MHFSIFYEIVRSLKIIHFKEIHLIIDQMKCRFVILNLLIARVIYIYIKFQLSKKIDVYRISKSIFIIAITSLLESGNIYIRMRKRNRKTYLEFFISNDTEFVSIHE